eukprot:CAMPEP_0178377404 /NCGR_PEP_ID=MMETSP0689_2-20121128/3901_1 /TAXON_ID=160604 /ORGANISM="Amphidinium massartii, Strain CS-259" /LENGTH=693 /DNA_ID=CAMNT_0019997457 /DNA_START=134 /DNA_END=2211 /DNA_ORIENTATION=-
MWTFGQCCVGQKGTDELDHHTISKHAGSMAETDESMDTLNSKLGPVKQESPTSMVIPGEGKSLKAADASNAAPRWANGRRDDTVGIAPSGSMRISRRESEMPNDEDARQFYAEAINVNLCPTWMGTGMQVEHLVNMAQKLNIADHEKEVLERIFARIPKEVEGRLMLPEFLDAVRGGPASIALKNFVTRYRQGLHFGFIVDEEYDYSKTTNDNYGISTKEFHGDFKDIRQERDYSYHVNYSERRQRWQDRAIKSVVQRTQLQADPWLVYTCGPMGVGKGYAMSWMSKHGWFPLENIVHVDPDGFKLMMPEWSGYVEEDTEKAGTLCHMESCFMMEIAQEAAMQKRQNVWIDGSLRNAEFYARQFQEVRSKFPFYRIAIFYVDAPEAKIRERIKHRAQATGRDVPENLIQASLSSMDKSLNTLTPLCDFVVRISNEGAIPVLKACETIDTSGAWEVVTDRLTRKAGGPGSFPNALQPLTLSKLDKEHFPLLRVDTTTHNLYLDLGKALDGNGIHQKLRAILPKLEIKGDVLTISGVEPTEISYPEFSRPMMGIPRDASTMMYVYPFRPLAKSGVKRMLQEAGFVEQDMTCSLMQLLNRGGFCSCDKMGNLVGVDTVTNQEGQRLLQFDKRKEVPEKVKIPDSLFTPTPARYREAESYAFIPPGKTYDGVDIGGAHGALVFRLKVSGHPPVVSFP